MGAYYVLFPAPGWFSWSPSCSSPSSSSCRRCSTCPGARSAFLQQCRVTITGGTSRVGMVATGAKATWCS